MRKVTVTKARVKALGSREPRCPIPPAGTPAPAFRRRAQIRLASVPGWE